MDGALKPILRHKVGSIQPEPSVGSIEGDVLCAHAKRAKTSEYDRDTVHGDENALNDGMSGDGDDEESDRFPEASMAYPPEMVGFGDDEDNALEPLMCQPFFTLDDYRKFSCTRGLDHAVAEPTNSERCTLSPLSEPHWVSGKRIVVLFGVCKHYRETGLDTDKLLGLGFTYVSDSSRGYISWVLTQATGGRQRRLWRFDVGATRH
jgi:hypothetical protein